MSDFIFPSPRNCDLFDDFHSPVIDSTAKRVFSDLAWGYDGDGSVTQGVMGAGGPGELHLLSGDVDTNATYLFAGGLTNGGTCHVTDLQSFEWRVKPSNITHLIGAIGMGSSISDSSLGSDAIGFRIGASGAISTFTRSGSVETELFPGAALATGVWSRLVAFKMTSALWRFLVLDQSGVIAGVTEHSAHIPSAVLTLGVNAVCSGTSSSGQHFKLDLAALRLKYGLRL